jgi:BetI-type transcriptional repressor, C-terminal
MSAGWAGAAGGGGGAAAGGAAGAGAYCGGAAGAAAWLNARHLSRYRATLRDRVGHQEARWRDRLSGLIAEGAEAGTFRAADPTVAAIQILVVLDGLAAHANTDRGNRPPAVTNMAVSTAERVLNLPDRAIAAVRR